MTEVSGEVYQVGVAWAAEVRVYRLRAIIKARKLGQASA